ncbi:MAG: AAA family ATPase [Verrucomicrobia bacterium]|jgi:BioD-like phosphotransacetylase family protein|nr:AAA family ATPase [Verrucomicrobiota bacterium]
MNTETPRVFIAATRQNDGKTTVSLGLLAALQLTYPRVGFIKPVGQRFVRIDQHAIDEDTVLMDHVYQLNCPLIEMSPIAVEPDFTRKYLQSSNYETLVRRIQKAFDRVAWEKEFVLCEGSGHAGVGSVFDLSNARVAKLLNAKVVIVTQGGIGKPIDEVALNHALFEKEGVEVIGVIVNKVMADKLDYITEFARKGLKRKGIELLGVIPHQAILSRPTMGLIREELNAELLNDDGQLLNQVDDVLLGAMSVQNAMSQLRSGVLLIASGDRADLVLAAMTTLFEQNDGMAGIVLTGKIRPSPNVLKVIERMPFPVLLASQDIYKVASKVHDLIVKTRPNETDKISLIRDMVSKCVDVNRILKLL